MVRLMARFLLITVVIAALAVPVAEAWTSALGPAGVMGGGNFGVAGSSRVDDASQFEVLTGYYGARMLRMDAYPGDYFDDASFTVLADHSDDLMNASYVYGVTPMFLFEYYYNQAGFPPVGNYSKWYAIGRGFAQRFAPNVGSFWVERGIAGFGCEVWAAFNEPEGTGLNYTLYHDALEGLADGVHSVDPALRVIPGGFKNANAASDYTLGGYGTAIADLLNNGKLDGVDLHTYYDIAYAPLENRYSFSANSNFRSVKQTLNLTRDINFYSSEFNYKTYNSAWPPEIKANVTQAYAAKQLLCGIWDNLGALKSDGVSSANQFSFVWNLFNNATSDPSYGLAEADYPHSFAPTPRAQTVQLVLNLTAGMNFETLDPFKSGTYTLSRSDGTKMWVFQNRKAWTNILGQSFLVQGIPQGSKALHVWGWDGLRSSYPLNGSVTTLNVSNLNLEETYMFIAEAPSTASGRDGGASMLVFCVRIFWNVGGWM